MYVCWDARRLYKGLFSQFYEPNSTFWPPPLHAHCAYVDGPSVLYTPQGQGPCRIWLGIPSTFQSLAELAFNKYLLNK